MIKENGGSFRTRGRNIWMLLHRWLGLVLLIVLIPISASGSLLVWDDWTDGLVNPQRYVVSKGREALPVSDYIASARGVLPSDFRIATVTFPAEAGKPLVVTASKPPEPGAKPGQGQPPRTQVWIDPGSGRILDHADPGSGVLRTLHVFHGSLMIPGTGRTIVGWLGVAMLISALTGLWLWLPVRGSLPRGLRWNRAPSLSSRLHHQFGFWVAVPLAVLAFTGAYISFPNATRAVEGLFTGSNSRAPSAPARAAPAANPMFGPDEALAAARDGVSGGRLISLRWPTERAAEWAVLAETGGARREIIVDDSTGQAGAAKPPAGGPRFMRTLHDGNGYNVIWQTIIFIAGLVPALLGITGLIMWLRGSSARRRFSTQQAVPAE